MGLLLDQTRAIAAGERTSVEVVTAALEAAEKLQPQLNAFTQIYADEALEEARAADASDATLPLSGVPVAVKDLFDVATKVTSGCSEVYRNAPPATADSAAVRALRRAGAIVIGKTNMHEFAFGATNTVSSYGQANNPWDVDRIPGGSSGGSGAAVGARIVGLALGTDTGGSIRMPAVFCGATGLKTTWGHLSLAGVMPMAPGMDSVGPIATDAADAALAFQVLSGAHTTTEEPRPVDGLRVGIARDPWFDVIEPDLAVALARTAEWFSSHGARVAEASMPWVQAAHDAWLVIALAEFGREYRMLAGREEEMDPSSAIILHAGIALAAEDERSAREQVVTARAGFAELMKDFDVILAPATPFAAPRHDDQTITVAGVDLPVHIGGPSRYTRPISVLPAAVLVVPIGHSPAGLPHGAQLIGGPLSEQMLLDVGVAYQAETDWHTRLPPLHA